MSDLDKILLTSVTTILGGLIIYSINQTFQIFIFEPIKNFRLLMGEIEDTLVFYANIFGNPGTPSKEKSEEAQVKLRSLASQLSAKAYAVRAYKFLAFLHIVPAWKNIKKAHGNLIGLSNLVFLNPGNNPVEQAIHNSNLRDEIRTILGIMPLE